MKKRFSVISWFSAGVAGSVSFWLFQVISGEATITQFMGDQIATEGGYPLRFAPLIGWGVHLTVSLSYALLFTVILWIISTKSAGATLGIGLVLALALGWITTLLTAPAITTIISLLSGKGFPAELPPLNAEVGLPLYNHLLFFAVVWVFTTLFPTLTRRAWQPSL